MLIPPTMHPGGARVCLGRNQRKEKVTCALRGDTPRGAFNNLDGGLEVALLAVRKLTVDTGEAIKARPTTLIVRSELYWQAKLILEPWRRGRKKWLRRRK